MILEDFLEQTLAQVEDLFTKMEHYTPKVSWHRECGYRHDEYSAALACYLKGIKSLSTVRAAVVLLRAGFVQEVGALCRITDEVLIEVMFLVVPQGADGQLSSAQNDFLEDFFQEEFQDGSDPLASQQKRKRVAARRIRAGFSKLAGELLNEFELQQILGTVQNAFSGYVHGAYPHIMEMYGGEPPRFHTSGMLGTPRINEWRHQLVTYSHRVLMASVLIAGKLGTPSELQRSAYDLLKQFERSIGFDSAVTAKELMAKFKGSRRPSPREQ